GASGGSQVAAAVRARSADHLIFADARAIEALRSAGVVATLLPNAAFYLKLGRFAPARAMIDASVPVALATDVNPGGGFSPSMPFAMTLACFGMGLTFEEALAGATINGAYSLDRHETAGSLEPGKLMDAVLVAGDAIDLIRIGAPSIPGVFKRGRLVAGALEAMALRDVHRGVPRIVDADAQEQQRGAADHEERFFRMSGEQPADRQQEVPCRGKAPVPDDVLELGAIFALAAGRTHDPDQV